LAILVVSNNQLFGQYNWTKDVRNPILGGSSWNKNLLHPSILFNADSGRYEMWFDATTAIYVRPYSIGYAVSDNGIAWTIHPTPVLTADQGTWDEGTVEEPNVIRENGQYKMWYTGGPMGIAVTKIGYATSPDGITWTKYAGNPVIEPGTSAWDMGGPMGNCVLVVAEVYKMWYSAYEVFPSNTSRIGYATSIDGIVWQVDTLNNPVLTLGASGQWDDFAVIWPHVQYLDSTYFMWYTGASGPGEEQVGMATSLDGIVWTKNSQNPVLVRQTSEWDGHYIEGGTVLLIDSTLHMWYSGGSGSNNLCIGHATSPLQPTSIYGAEKGIDPKYLSLEQNYPNPFNPITNIQFSNPKSQFISLEIYNVLGQKVASLVSEKLNPGVHKYEWQAGGLPSGIYYCRIQAGEFEQVRKMVLLR
jgi:predicted GH43/DUF377 family glycosyl hydrolase